jgi:hypothetical protein
MCSWLAWCGDPIGVLVACVCCRATYRLWEQSEVSDDIGSQLPSNPVADTFAQLMTGLYAKLQIDAGAPHHQHTSNSPASGRSPCKTRHAIHIMDALRKPP